jgi:hypothetical protein
MASLLQSLGSLLNDEAGIAVLERQLSDANRQADGALAALRAAETAVKHGQPGAWARKEKAKREALLAYAAVNDLTDALTTARASRAEPPQLSA